MDDWQDWEWLLIREPYSLNDRPFDCSMLMGSCWSSFCSAATNQVLGGGGVLQVDLRLSSPAWQFVTVPPRSLFIPSSPVLQ